MSRSIAANILLLGILPLSCAAHPDYGDSVFGMAPVSDEELASATGKFLLPGGIEVAMTVRSDTVVDGQILLRSVFAVDNGPATLRVLAPAAGQAGPGPAPSPPAAVMASAQMSGVAVIVDRDSGISTLRQTWGIPTANIWVGPSATNTPVSDAGLTTIALAPGGPAVETGGGIVSLASLPVGHRISLEGQQLAVTHLVGQAFGTIVENSASNRSIDTMTTIDLDLRNATPDVIGSSLARVSDLAIDATRGLIR